MEDVLLKNIDKGHSVRLLNEMHSGECGYHYTAKTTTHKVIQDGFWWSTLFRDVHELVMKCDACQRFTGKLKFLGNVPLRPVEVQALFQHGGLNL